MHERSSTRTRTAEHGGAQAAARTHARATSCRQAPRAVLDRVQQHLGVQHMEDLWLVAGRHGRLAAARIPRVLLAEERRLRHLTSAVRHAERMLAYLKPQP